MIEQIHTHITFEGSNYCSYFRFTFRYMAVTKITKYHSHTSKHKANYVALYTWIHSLLFSLPLFFQNQTIGITCRAFVERCLCGLVEGTSIVFT